MQLAALLLAAVYSLPDGQNQPAPDPAQQARIVRALETIRKGEGESADFAVRDLALVGEPALPIVVARLNEAPANERLLLLAAVRRIPRAAALLEQAAKDPSPAVRAWVQRPPAHKPQDLRYLAARYLDLLALAEEKRRVDADRDLEGLVPRVGHPMETFEPARERMRDRRLADDIQAERAVAAGRFARAGAQALREHRLVPSLKDPVFMAYLALLREEGWPLFYALPALVSLGEPLAPVLEPLLFRENHDARVVFRILAAVRADRGAGLYPRLLEFPPDAQGAMVALAPRILGGDALVELLERAALAKSGDVRATALDELLRLPPPAGKGVARTLLDPGPYEGSDFQRAAKLLARCGELDLLASYAEVAVPDDGSERAAQLRQLQRICAKVLRSDGGDAGAAVGERFLGSESQRLRTLGVDLIRDPARLVELARAHPDAGTRSELATRALLLGGRKVAGEVIAILRAEGDIPLKVFHMLADEGCVDELVALTSDPAVRDRALDQLAQLPSIDPKHEKRLLGIHDADPGPRTLEAILPLGTDAVRERIAAADPEQALSALAGHAEQYERAPVSFPMIALIAGADAGRLRNIQQCAGAQATVEPGLFHALFIAWDRLEPGDPTDPGSPGVRKIELLDVLARSDDARSAQLLFDDLLAGKFKDPALVLGTLKAASRLVPAGKLAALQPLIRERVKGEYPLPGKQLPVWDKQRAAFLRGSIHTLGYARVEDALPTLCDLLLDPKLQPSAYDGKFGSGVPYEALNALRNFKPVRVNAALRKALSRAELDGRLAALQPSYLLYLTQAARAWRRPGRGLYEVGLALCEVLERLPWQGDVPYEKMRALGGLRRYTEAAAAAREGAVRQRARGYGPVDGVRTPAYMEGRALLYDALAAGDKGRLREALSWIGDDLFLLNLAAWYAVFYVQDLSLAEEAAARAVRGSAGLYHPYRDTLAAVRIRQSRAADAIHLLDPDQNLPVKRDRSTGWHLYFLAKTQLLRGEERDARRSLERALADDRRLIPTALADPAFRGLGDVFKRVEEEFFDSLFAWED